MEQVPEGKSNWDEMSDDEVISAAEKVYAEKDAGSKSNPETGPEMPTGVNIDDPSTWPDSWIDAIGKGIGVMGEDGSKLEKAESEEFLRQRSKELADHLRSERREGNI